MNGFLDDIEDYDDGSPEAGGFTRCRYCGEDVQWERERGRWKLFNEDGRRHRCTPCTPRKGSGN